MELLPLLEPYAGADGARTKDKIENKLHDLVCSGQLPLATAQHAIATNWWAAFRRTAAEPNLPCGRASSDLCQSAAESLLQLIENQGPGVTMAIAVLFGREAGVREFQMGLSCNTRSECHDDDGLRAFGPTDARDPGQFDEAV
ncbi:MAG TPA: hypothetical protein VGN33_08015, partial [Leifsonia sp.]|jgi:hypothetical protein|nr:hypothetical protein [Leifsonia sp.]